MIPHDHAHYSLRYPSRSDYRLGSHNVVTQAVVTVRRVQNICFSQQYQFLVSKLHVPDGLVEAKATSVLDISHSEV